MQFIICFFAGAAISYAAGDDVNNDDESVAGVVFKLPKENSTDFGYLRLTWEFQPEDADDYQVEVQQSTNKDFSKKKIIYKGGDRATFVSGLANGEYYFRIRTYNDAMGYGHWSDPVKLDVQHHSLELAFTLFGIGVVVFLATTALIIHGSLNQQEG